jgi:hypothetical protein
MPEGIDIKLCFSHKAVCLPLRQIQEHIDGQVIVDTVCCICVVNNIVERNSSNCDDNKYNDREDK